MRAIHFVAEAILAALFTAMLVVGTLQVTNRFFFNSSLSWSEEFQKFAFIWLVFLAIPAAYHRASHLHVDALINLFAPPVRRGIALAIDLLWLGLGLAFVRFTWQLMQVAQYQTSAGLGVNMAWVYGGMLIGGVYLTLTAIQQIAARIRRSEAPA